jgi:hypothetical protein
MMASLFFFCMLIFPSLLMSLVMWLISKKTKVEGRFREWFLLSLVASLSVFIPLKGFYFLLPLLFLLLWKWRGIKFWPEVKFWPDSTVVWLAGWGANYLFLIILRYVMIMFRHN